MARQLTGPVAEAPDVDFRRTARSLHQAKPGLTSGWGQQATDYFSRDRSRTKPSYGENKGLLSGVYGDDEFVFECVVLWCNIALCLLCCLGKSSTN